MADARDVALTAAVSDSSSAYYQGLMRLLRAADAAKAAAESRKMKVRVPLTLGEHDQLALERQFAVQLQTTAMAPRMRASARVAGLIHVLDAALMEIAKGPGRRVLWIDGDLIHAAAMGSGVLVERSHISARLQAGYFLEEEAIRAVALRDAKDEASIRALRVWREVTAGGGTMYWPRVRSDGPAADVVVVNHFKTNAPPEQLAWIASQRGAMVIAAIPFQLDFLTSMSGSLVCFPGTFERDDGADLITFVPAAEPTMTISHCYSDLVAIATRGAVVVEGAEYICEKFMAVEGLLYYTLRKLGTGFELPETLRTCYFDKKNLAVTELRYPKVRLSPGGVPVGWDRGSVRIPTARLEKTLMRVAASVNTVVTPTEVMTALVDYNNLVLNTLDTAVVAERMSVENEEEAAVAIALHVNWQRHAARGTLNTLLTAVKARFAASEATLPRLACMALVHWWSRPEVKNEVMREEIPVAKVVDACGSDFSVVIEEANPWVEFEEVVGDGAVEAREYKPRSSLPAPATVVADKPRWLADLLCRVRGQQEVRKLEQDAPPLKVRGCPGLKISATQACVVARHVTMRSEQPPGVSGLTGVKARLRGKLLQEQAAINETPRHADVEVFEPSTEVGVAPVPVVPVDPVAAINADLVLINGGPPERDITATGFRLAEVDIDKTTEGNLSVNDAKRAVPKGRWLRKSKIEAESEGMRAPSQASLLGAVFKRNIGVPCNRGAVDLDAMPDRVVDRVIDTCYRENWLEIVANHLDTGLWEANEADIDDFLKVVDEAKAKKMLDEFFSESEVDLTRWLLMAKGKVKPSRDPGPSAKIDHAQTIMYLDNSSTNAFYSAMTRRFKRVIDECLRPEIKLNAQESAEEHEEWYNSLEPIRRSLPATYSYTSDIKCYDRAQEHPAHLFEAAFYRRHGLTKERLDIWTQTHGLKRATNMMYGLVVWVVWMGVSGIWKTILRNGLVNLAAFVVSSEVMRRDIVMLDIKGDDMDAEFSRPIDVQNTIARMSLSFNFSGKVFTNDVRYMCKDFRIRMNGRWYFMADPWARVQSAATPFVMGNSKDTMEERWVSLRADLRHYDNGVLVDAAAEAAQQFYGLSFVPYGLARGLAELARNKLAFYNSFHAPCFIS